MPAGCEFICKNKECQDNDKGFVITAPWPLAKIELVITSLTKWSSTKPNLKLVLEKIIEFKNEGRKFACITFPDPDRLPIEAYRINLWSQEARSIWQYDVEINDSESLEEILINTDIIPEICPKTGCKLQNFVEVSKEGINCPSCGEKLHQSRWFTNETC